jgi:hypothetical protein
MRPLEIFKEGLSPPVGRMLANVVVGNLKSLLLLILRHVNGNVNIFGDLIHVIRVDLEDAT